MRSRVERARRVGWCCELLRFRRPPCLRALSLATVSLRPFVFGGRMRTALLSVLHLSLTLGPGLAQPSAESPMKWTEKAADTPGVASCSMRAPGPVNLALVRSEYGVALNVSGTLWTASRDV